ncbi:pentapeptide repeat-containing protein [Actinosynnema sp. NPDC000082]|uniref:pentapeptide repeat-containing protein n=1 Tax=Actinosynnema sp. NPDC000082 TaxID=3363910 RepID=UPI0036AA3F6E
MARRRAADHRRARAVDRAPRRRAAGVVGVLVGVLALLLADRVHRGAVDWRPVWEWVRARGVVAALVVVGAVAVIGGVRRWGPDRWSARDEERRVRPIRWWVVALAVALVVGAGWASVVVLLRVLPGAAAVPEGSAVVALEVVRLGLSVAAGVAGALVLAVTVRRQWLGERAQLHTEADTRERRVNDLYGSAAKQLGKDSDPLVRAGALRSLESLAQAYPEQRQRVVGLVCSLLRAPWTPPGAVRARGTAEEVERQEESLVRQTAQRLLTDHLRPERGRWGRVRDPRFWAGIDLDLTGARLVDFEADGIEVGSARFDRAAFDGDARFDDAAFLGGARFDAAAFTATSRFSRTAFTRDASFDDAVFTGATEFHGTAFTGEARFTGATFSGDARFTEAVFTGDAGFHRVTFAGDVRFTGAVFSGARFNDTAFAGDAWFHRTAFVGTTLFRRAAFDRDARFDETVFTGDVDFREAEFAGDVWFQGTDFGGGARFDDAAFVGTTRFYRVDFASAPAFDRAGFAVPARCRNVLAPGGSAPPGWVVDGASDPVARRRTGSARWAPVPLVLPCGAGPEPGGHLTRGAVGGAARAARRWSVASRG